MFVPAPWLADISERPVVDVADRLGMKQIGRASTSAIPLGPCPACDAERRHTKSRDRRGAIRVKKATPNLWWCVQCEQGGSSVDLVAYALHGARFRELTPAQKDRVRDWCCEWSGIDPHARVGAGAGSVARASAPRSITRALEPPPEYPPGKEVGYVWYKAARRLDEDPVVSKYLRRRGIDATALADLDIARALRPDAELPAWAGRGIRRWNRTGHRIVSLLFGPNGLGRSLIARCVESGGDSPKSLAPQGYSREGLVMASEMGKLMLRHGHPSQWPQPDDGVPFALDNAEWWPPSQPLQVVVAEGEIDLWTWATEWSDAAEHPPAVLGVVQGAWSAEIAARIPDGSDITLAQDLDEKGEQYARLVIDTLRGRRLSCRRWKGAA